MKKYVIKIRVFPPRKINLGVISQILPDYNKSFIQSYYVRRADFKEAVSEAMGIVFDCSRYIGVRAEIVDIAEV